MLIFCFYFSIQGKSNLNAIPVVYFSSSVFSFCNSVGRGDLWSQLERKTWQTRCLFSFSFFVILHWNGKWNRCSIFLDRYTNEVFLVWWYCTIPNISGAVVSLNTASLQISDLALKNWIWALKTRFDVQTWPILCSLQSNAQLLSLVVEIKYLQMWDSFSRERLLICYHQSLT